MAQGTFVDILSSLRRKAQLSGRPLSSQEVGGAVAGQSEAASERMYRGKMIEESRLTREAQIRAAEKAHRRDESIRKRRLYDPTAWCIIVSACTHPQSYEVNIARLYRDWVLDKTTLTGYYLLALFVAPLIQKHRPIKRFFKRYLVDRLIDYAETVFCLEPGYKFKTSKLATNSFLKLCKMLGNVANFILRRH